MWVRLSLVTLEFLSVDDTDAIEEIEELLKHTEMICIKETIKSTLRHKIGDLIESGKLNDATRETLCKLFLSFSDDEDDGGCAGENSEKSKSEALEVMVNDIIQTMSNPLDSPEESVNGHEQK